MATCAKGGDDGAAASVAGCAGEAAATTSIASRSFCSRSSVRFAEPSTRAMLAAWARQRVSFAKSAW